MNDRYHVFKHGQKRGPFSLDDLLGEVESGRIDYEDFCLRIGASTCERIRATLDWDDSHLLSNALADEIDSTSAAATPTENESLANSEKFEDQDNIDDDQGSSKHDDHQTYDEATNSDSIEGDDIDPEIFQFDYDEEKQDEEEHVDDSQSPTIDYDEERNQHSLEYDEQEGYDEDFLADDDDEESSPDRVNEIDEPSSGPPEDSTAILYSGRPSLLSYPNSLLLIALNLIAAIWMRHQFDWVLFAGLSVALIVFIQLQFRRIRHQYYITPKQVEVIHGLILESSREICIEDIGAIYIHQRGLHGLLGLATIEFAAAESPMPILVFHNIRSARRIKDLIRRLQDALE